MTTILSALIEPDALWLTLRIPEHHAPESGDVTGCTTDHRVNVRVTVSSSYRVEVADVSVPYAQHMERATEMWLHAVAEKWVREHDGDVVDALESAEANGGEWELKSRKERAA